MKKLICLMLAVLLLAGCAPATYDGPTEAVPRLTFGQMLLRVLRVALMAG